MDERASGEDDLAAQGDAIRELAAHIHAAEARLADMLGRFVAHPRWNQGDWRSPTHWVTVNCGYAPAEAAALTRIAAAAPSMPLVMERARAGEVSSGVTAMAARVATPEIDEQLADIVTTATPTQARRVMGTFRDLSLAASASADPADGDNRNFWNSWFDDRGDWCARGKAPAEVGALLDEAYQAARRAAERDAADGDSDADDAEEDLARRRVPCGEALRLLGELALESAQRSRLTRPGGEAFTVTVLVDLATLVSGTLRVDSTCRLEAGPEVTPELVRRLSEEGSLEILWHREGVPLKLGRKFRLASREQRRALRFRDGGCAVPGCTQRRYVHAHHVERWADGGSTDLDNQIRLCGFHHRLIHHHGWTVVADGDQTFTFRDRHGRVVGNRLVEQIRTDGRPPPGRLEARPDDRHLDIGPGTARSLGGGEPVTACAADTWMHRLLTASAAA